MAHLCRIILPVGDINAAAAFYGRVLGSDGQRISPGRHYFDCEAWGGEPIVVEEETFEDKIRRNGGTWFPGD